MKRWFVFSLSVLIWCSASAPPGLPYFTLPLVSPGAPACADGGITANWAVRVVNNGGANPSAGTTNAILTFVCGAMSDGFWAKIDVANIGAPDNLIAYQTPLVRGPGADPWVNSSGLFLSGDLSVNGLTGNASNKSLQSGVSPTAFGSATTIGFAWYAYTSTGTGYDLGIYDESEGILGASSSGGTSHGYNGAFPGNGVSPATSGNGFYGDLRVSSTDHRLFFANSTHAFAQIGSTDAASWTGAFPNSGCYVFAINDTLGAVQLFTSDTISGVFFFHGFTSTDLSNLYTRFQAFRTAVGGGFR